MNFNQLSFILGLFAADGNLDKSRVRFFCSREEESFFRNTVKPLIENVFEMKTTLRFDSASRCFVLSINSVEVEKFFRRVYNYNGKKWLNLKLPKCKIDDSSFVAGLIAGDGSIIVTRNGSLLYNYPLMNFSNKSKVIIGYFSAFLTRNKIGHSVSKRKDGSYTLIVRGGELQKMLRLIPITNSVQKTKLLVLDEVGYLLPKTGYEEMLKILNNKEAPIV